MRRKFGEVGIAVDVSNVAAHQRVRDFVQALRESDIDVSEVELPIHDADGGTQVLVQQAHYLLGCQFLGHGKGAWTQRLRWMIIFWMSEVPS